MRNILVHFFIYILALGILSSCAGRKTNPDSSKLPAEVTISREELSDKIKGGWAGQTIGVTYGGPTEFKYNGRIIPDSMEIPWPETGYARDWFENRSWLYDDIYMDLTFVEVFEEYGLDAPVEKFANAFAYAEYPLWHANQAARYNIINGIMPPESGFWKNNPHADDIDFQIESDFAGLMSPGMPATASKICDKIGHIMNYGDGWYGGVYVSAMYSLAFISSDIDFIVKEGLKMIPQESDFYKLISDVITWSAEQPDWKKTWYLLEDKWGNKETCPKGFSIPFNIEAKMNCAYILMGLLYGEGDMGKTVEISTRCGADSDCNPSNAAGILGTAIGYSNIPDRWLNNIREVEDQLFPFTSLSLNDTYHLTLKHAIESIKKEGGKVSGEKITITVQKPEAVRFEESFSGITPSVKIPVDKKLTRKGFVHEFNGRGILISAEFPGKRSSTGNYVAEIRVSIDGEHVETVEFPADFKVRKLDLYWNFDLKDGQHVVNLDLINPDPENYINLNYIIEYQ